MSNHSPVEEWAYAFSTFGKDDLRRMLFQIAYDIRENDEDRVVVEFSTNDKGQPVALPITGHVENLEESLEVDNRIEQQFGVTD